MSFLRDFFNKLMLVTSSHRSGADPGFLERGSIYIRVWGFAFLFFFIIFLKYPIKMKQFGLTETKLFHFHRVFKKGRGFEQPPEPPLDLPL